MTDPFLPDDDRIPAIREALPATSAGIYMNTGTAGPLPRETSRVMADLEGWELRTGRAHEAFYEESLQRMVEARSAVAAVLTTDPDRIALTHATTDGMNVAAWAIDWRPGDRIVTSSLEHPGGLGALWSIRERFAVDLVVADLARAGGDAEIVAAFDAAIAPGTRLVALSHVSWATGALLPVARIAEIAHQRGALVAIDGAQAAGALAVPADEIGADFYAVPGQKWLLGPEGAGALYCAPSVFDRVRTSFAGFFGFESLGLDARGRPWPDARRFEGSNYHKPSVAGMARSCAWLATFVGLPWIYERTAQLGAAARAMFAAVPGVEILTPPAMGPLLTFRIAGWPAAQALDEIQRRTFLIARTIPPLDAVRLSIGFFNTAGELRRVRDAVALLAEHTPDSLPARPKITIIQGGR